MKRNLQLFEDMDIKRLIIKMSLPAVISMIVQALYNIVDSIFVAKISEDALTALSLAFPIQMIIVSIFVGLGIGINSYMSRKLGEKNKNEAVNTAEHGIVLGITIWAFLAIGSFFIPQLFFKLFTDNQIVLNYAIRYTQIIMLFSFGSILTEICMNILRATGDMISSMRIQILGAVINIILDPILIFGFLFIPKLGVTGAAIATVSGQICAMTYAFYLVLRNKSGLDLKLTKLHFKIRIIKEILRVGIPAILMMLLSSIMITGINYILGRFSDTSIAVFGAYYKLQSFIYMPVFGLTQGMMPIVGYNYGAKNFKRVSETLKFCILYASIVMLIGTILFQFFPRTLLSLFSCTEKMYSIGIVCLRTISIGFVFSGIVIVLSTFFQSLGKARISLLISFTRQIVILLPAAYLLSKFLNLKGIWLSFPIAETVTLAIGLIFIIKVFKEMFIDLNKKIVKGNNNNYIK